MNKSNLSRRNFLKASALAGVGASFASVSNAASPVAFSSGGTSLADISQTRPRPAGNKPVHDLTTKPLALILLCLCFVAQAQADAFRISFLQDNQSREDTISLLQTNGFSKMALDSFRKALNHYYTGKFNLDMSKFPLATNGFFTFTSVNSYLSALPINELQNIDHEFEMNCFETVACLAGDRVKCAPEITEQHSYNIKTGGTNGQNVIVCATSMAEAVDAAYPRGYMKLIQSITGREWTDSMTALSVTMQTVSILPPDTTPENIRTKVFETFRGHWTSCHLQKSDGFHIILWHNAIPAVRYAEVVHAAILIKRSSEFTYIEKDGPKGPFVRLDFSSLSTLQDFYRSKIRSIRSKYAVFFFITIDNDQILELNSQQTGSRASVPAARDP